MGDPLTRKAVVLELFAATGESIPEDDPIVTGAILFSHKLNEVAKLSAEEMWAAGQLAADAVHVAARKASLVLHEASERCAAESAAASAKAETAARTAMVLLERLAADRAQLLKLLEADVVKRAKLVRNVHPSPITLRRLPAWCAAVGLVAGSVAFSVALTVRVEQNSALAKDAAVGREFLRALPTMNPKLKQQLMEHVRKHPG